LALGFFPFFLIMLKPTYLILVFVVFFFLLGRFFLFDNRREIFLGGLLGLSITVVGLLGYCGMNQKFNGQFVLSNIALNNSLAHITISGAYQYGGDDELIAIIDKTRHINYYAAPFSINNHFIDTYTVAYRNFPKYLPPTEDMIFCSSMPDTINYPPERIKRFIRNAQCTTIYFNYMMKRALNMIVAAYGNLFLLLTLQLVLVAGVFVKYKKIAWAQAFCILLVLGQFFSIWLVGLDDMDRHLIPSYPFLMQIGASFLSVVISYLKKRIFPT